MFLRQNYRIYPNKEQQSILNQWIGSVRYIWNYMLDLNIKTYNDTKKFIFGYDMNVMLPKLKKQKETEWLKKVPSQGLQQKCQDLDTALKASFKSTNSQKGFPKFKSKKTDESGIRFHDFKIKDNKIFLPKIKKGIKIVIDRELLGESGMITVRKNKINQYFVSIIVDVGNRYDCCILPKDVETCVGIDVGVKSFITTSDGEVIENPHFLKKELKRLKKLHHNHSRKVKGSNNREKSRFKLAKLYNKITNQRKDFIKQNASMIAKLYDFVSVESLNVSGMVKNHNLAQSIIDVSFASFITELEWQCKKRGKLFHKIDKWFPSSKTCHCCGHIKSDLSLSDRTFICPICNTSIDRDLNASINILKEGMEEENIIIPKELGKFTPVRYDSTLVDSEQETSVL